MDDKTATTPNVFMFHIVPAPGVSPADLELRLLAQSSAFGLAALPRLDPAMLSHRILRGAGGGHVWLIALEATDVPLEDDEAAPGPPLDGALLDEMRARIQGFGEVTSSAAYADMSVPAADLGVARVSMDGEVVSFGTYDLPGWEDYAADAGTEEAGTELPAEILEEIQRSRAAVPAEPGMKRWGKGHMYGGGSDKDHVAYVRDYLENRAARASAADRRKILAFRAFQAREGSTAAINTYDNQIVTWGTGWGGLGWLGSVMRRATANTTFRERLGAAGVRYRSKNVYDVVDLNKKRVVTGSRAALEVMRSSEQLLYLLIQLARDEATRDAATEAQLVTFMGGSANVSGADAVATQALFNLIAHLKHWAPGYVMGCLKWAVPRAGDGEPSAERDHRLAVLVGRYFYGKARKYRWIPAWKQFQLYWKHMKDDGLDCLSDPFIQATAAPTDDPFAGDAPATKAAAPATKAAAPAAPPGEPLLKNAPLAGQAELEAVAAGRSALRRGARGAGVKAIQEALIALGYKITGGADGIFGPSAEAAIKSFQGQSGLTTDGIVGKGTLKALDGRLAVKASV